MVQLRRLGLALVTAVGASVALSGVSPAQETKTRPAPGPDRNKLADDRAKEFERASGVIVKIEPTARASSTDASRTKPDKDNDSSSARGPVRVTINTAAVWRDWVRDQAVNPAKAGRAKDAAGANSVATKGEPQSPDTLIVVSVPNDARLAARFRSSTDEMDEGAPTVAGAEANEKGPAARREPKPGKSKRSAAKPDAITLADLKVGMFAQVEYRQDAKGKNAATSLVVLKPIGGPDTPARQEEPKK